MTLRPLLVAAAVLVAGTGHTAPNYNGRVQGVFDGRAIDLPLVCSWPVLAGQSGPWFYAQSDPPTLEYAQDRNGDGIAISVSFSGKDAMFLLFINGRDYNFGNTQKEQVSVTPSGFVLTMSASRYEGKGSARQKVGEQPIRLSVDCPKR